MSPLILGLVTGVLALFMVVLETLGWKQFSIQLTGSCALQLWVLLAIYSALQLFVWSDRRRSERLTNEELETYGQTLSDVTPLIIEKLHQKANPKHIIAELETSHGLPQRVTANYMLALARHIRENGSGG